MAHIVEFTDTREKVDVEMVGIGMDASRQNITAEGDTASVFRWNRYIICEVSFSGVWTSNRRPVFIDRMKAGNAVGVVIDTPDGERWTGSIGYSSVKKKSNQKGTKAEFSAQATFTGAITIPGSKDETHTATGLKLGLIDGSYYKRGYQDKRIDAAVRPFYLDGLTNASTGLESGMDIAESGAGGNVHAYPGDASLLVHDASIRWAGLGDGVGYFHYARGATDCIPAHVNVTQGFVTERTRTQGDVESGSNGSICDSFAIVSINTIKVEAPVYQFDVPCVWTISQFRTAIAAVGTLLSSGPVINNATYTVDGVTYATRTMRFDGIYGSPVEGRDGAYMRGAIRLTWKPNTWQNGSLICVRYAQLPLEGSQTVASWTPILGFKKFYQYPTATLTAIATLCSRCYS